MAYKFQLGAYTASGSLNQEGALECETSLTIGSAEMSESDLEKLDDITDGTGAANKALVLDSNRDVDTINALGIASMANNWTNAGRTVADMGILTTVDINGGTVDGATIGASSHSTGKFTTVDATTDFTIDGLVLTADTITNDAALSIVSTGLTLNASLDIALSADGGNVTMDDGTTTIFDFDVDDTKMTIHDDQDTGDKFSIAVAQHGATTFTTVDDDATAANLTMTIDGDISLAAAGENIKFGNGTDPDVFDFAVDATPVLKIMDGAQAQNYCSIAVGVNGATTITTVDTDAAAANLIITADGTVDIDSAGAMTLDSGGQILLEPAAGSNVLIDGNVAIDAGVVTGITALTATAIDGVIGGDTARDGTFTAVIGTTGVFSSTLQCATSLTIGSAAMSEADLEKLDGITNGTVAAAKAVVADSNLDFSGFRNISGSGNFDLAGNIDCFGNISVNGDILPVAADGSALGSSSKEWSDLYLADAGAIYLGNDQDISLVHNADRGVILHQNIGNGGAATPAKLTLRQSSSSPADNDAIGALAFDGYTDGQNIGSYAFIEGYATDVTDDNKDGAIVFAVSVSNNPVEMMDIGKTAASTITIKDGAYDFDIASHDSGSNGLRLGGTLVTSTASELNILDGVTADAGELNKLDGVTATTAELNYLDLTTLGTSEASKAVSADASGDITIAGAAANMVWDKSEDALEFADNASIEMGSSQDMKLYHDGTNSYITNAVGALKIATETADIAITIGNASSEVTIADNLTVSGDLTVTGTTTTVNVEMINTSNGVIFEGSTDDAHETTLIAEDADADHTFYLPDLGGSADSGWVAAFDANPADSAAGALITATAAELSLLDGSAKSTSSITIADADAFVIIDGSTTKQIPASDLKTYLATVATSVASGSNTVTLSEGVNYFGDHGEAITAKMPDNHSTVGASVKVKAGSDCTVTNKLTINAYGGQSIDGSDSIILESPYAAVELVYVVSGSWRVF